MNPRSRYDSLLSRRDLLKLGGAATLGSFAAPHLFAAEDRYTAGLITGETHGELVGLRVLENGGNAVDAAVAGALTAAITSPEEAGIGGYAMYALAVMDGGKRIVAIDGNGQAPAALTRDLFKLGPTGLVPERDKNTGWLSTIGWMSAGVPGLLGGLQLVLDQCGTRKFGELAQPAIRFCREGFPFPARLNGIVNQSQTMRSDPGSRKLYYRDDKAIETGAVFKNPELADLLDTLAKANSVEAFYRGDIAQRIAEGFAKNGGLVTAQDLAAYKPRVVTPITSTWDEHVFYTNPPTAGGLTTLQMLRLLRALDWHKLPEGVERTHLQVEAMRLAWRDRVNLLGDPDFADVPIKKLLSDEYAEESAEQIRAVVKAGKFLQHGVAPNHQKGTINMSAADRFGNFVALTLTHGNAFGSRMTVDGLGLTLGSGLCRFDPRPDHPNGPAPGKRPLNNMSPMVVTREGRPVLAIGGTGGRVIPNSMFEVLKQHIVLGKPIAEAVNAPRIHTEGNETVAFEPKWPAAEVDGLGKFGYSVNSGNRGAKVGAVAEENHALQRARR